LPRTGRLGPTHLTRKPERPPVARFAADIDQATISRLTGEFRDPDMERRFRLAVLADWQARFRANAAVLAGGFTALGALDYSVLGWSTAFYVLLSARLSFAALALSLLAVRFVPDRIRRYDRWTLILAYATAATFCAVIGIRGLGLMTAAVVMVSIITQLYLFLPNRPALAVAAALPSTMAFLAIFMRSTEIGSLDFTTLASTLLVFNAAGAASALRVARLERQRFATREAELRTLAQLTAQSHELANARDDANHANRAKSEFLAHMSHELRTPLNAINGFSEIIKDEMFGPAPPRYRDYAADIHRSGMHLTALINDILDLSKVEAGKLEIHDEIVAPALVVEACFRLLKDRASKARLSLHALVPPDAPQLRADARVVKQILLNLLTNAIKFTPAGGDVRVVGRRLPGGGFALAVEDTGVGIAAADIPRVLEPYGQVGAARRHNPDGTGLGLPLVKKMIELHGGTLALESTPGVGTVATVTFPAARVTAPDDRATAAPLAKAS